MLEASLVNIAMEIWNLIFNYFYWTMCPVCAYFSQTDYIGVHDRILIFFRLHYPNW